MVGFSLGAGVGFSLGTSVGARVGWGVDGTGRGGTGAAVGSVVGTMLLMSSSSVRQYDSSSMLRTSSRPFVSFCEVFPKAAKDGLVGLCRRCRRDDVIVVLLSSVAVVVAAAATANIAVDAEATVRRQRPRPLPLSSCDTIISDYDTNAAPYFSFLGEETTLTITHEKDFLLDAAEMMYFETLRGKRRPIDLAVSFSVLPCFSHPDEDYTRGCLLGYT